MAIFDIGVIGVLSKILYSLEKAIVRSTEQAIHSLENIENAFGN